MSNKRSENLSTTIAAMLSKAPFFGGLLLDLCELHEVEELPFPACTDGKNIYLHTETFGKWPLPERVFVLAHEVLHVVWQHCGRFKLYMDQGAVAGLPYHPEAANLAADAIINAALRECQVGSMPSVGFLHKKIDGSMGFEEAYKIVYEENSGGGKGRGKGEGNGDGSGGDSPQDGCTLDGHMPSDPTAGPSEAETARAIKQAQTAAKAFGNMPASLEALIGQLTTPKISWREHLRDALTKITRGNDARSWSRVNRRRLSLMGQVWPGSVGLTLGRVVIALDTSASVSEAEHVAFASEITGFFTEAVPEGVTLLWIDTRVQRVDELDTIDDYLGILERACPRGGGTAFTPAFKWVRENMFEPPEMLIYLTDGEGDAGPEVANYPTVWVTTNALLPWGTNIKMEL